MTRLAIIETDDAGTLIGIVRDLDECTSQEWDQIEAGIVKNVGKARLLTDMELKVNLLLCAAESVGMFRGNQLNLSPVLEPYFRSMIADHEAKKGLAKRLDRWRRMQRFKLIGWITRIFMKGVDYAFSQLKSLPK
ncbi:MAG: hypothetical protein QM669_12395 [Siphonobacter sp.]